ncbi:MAG: YicC family protein [candidate division KSB1 bacterium]|nr:YicC family protein [candidate division KSB1 bacterium]MDZ7365738.1 YicC family protein [candidate division KSB1 bacterium]MDZ7403782.1 YicC family protein [candidate division KSB1 bacterium]
MIISMTGFGRGQYSLDGYEAVVEVRSLNHRFLDVAIRLPRGLGAYEQAVKDFVRTKVNRGRINVAVTLKSESDSEFGLNVDEETARRYKHLLETLIKKLDLPGPVTLEHLLHFSDILTIAEENALPEQAWTCVEKALSLAMDEMNAMRLREGQEIANDLRVRLNGLQEKIERIKTHAASRSKDEFDKLYKRLVAMVDTKELDRTRLELEVALLADRVDITEECTRFQSHNTLFLEALGDSEPAGRKLNFLLQEMNREANTIGAKANDAQTAHWVVGIKEEVEKLREQIQNIE